MIVAITMSAMKSMVDYSEIRGCQFCGTKLLIIFICDVHCADQKSKGLLIFTADLYLEIKNKEWVYDAII